MEFVNAVESKIHSLNFGNTQMESPNFKQIILKVSLPNLLQINL
jgi:hypothetical protein